MENTKKRSVQKMLEEVTTDVKDKLLEEFQSIVKPQELEGNYGIYSDVMNEGVRAIAVRCKNCGHTFIDSNHSSGTVCPCCKTTLSLIKAGTNFYNGRKRTYWGRRNDDTSYLFAKKMSDFYLITQIERNFFQELDKNDFFEFDSENEYLNKPFNSLDRIDCHFIFSPEHGFRFIDICKVNGLTNKNNGYFRQRITNNFVKTDVFEEIFDYISAVCKNPEEDIVSAIIEYNDYLIKNKPIKEKKKTDIDDIFSEIKPLDIKLVNDCIIKKYSGNPVIKINQLDGKSLKYSINCICGKNENIENTFKQAGDNVGSLIKINHECKCCGRKTDSEMYPRDSQNTHINSIAVEYFQKIDENNVLLRIFSSKFGINKDNNHIEVFGTKEIKRIMFSEKKMFVEIRINNNWERQTIREAYISEARDYYWRKSAEIILYNTIDELYEIIDNTFLKRTGVMQAWGLKEYENLKIEGVGTLNLDSYLHQWYRKPYIEFTIKSGLKQATKDLMFATIDTTYKNKKNIYEMFNLSKNALKIAREQDCSLSDIRVIKKCCDYQPNVSIDTIEKIKETEVNLNYFIDVCMEANISYQRLLDYLQSVYDNQCIQKSVACNIYRDYYRMASKIGFDLSDKNVKFPSSLKKEHDRASFAYKVVEDEIKKQNFIEKTAASEKKYSFKNKKFTVIFPSTPDEVVYEGQYQHHCVANYVSRIESGDTTICFIRKNDDIDKPYFTVEIYCDKIFQVKGMSNRLPDKYTESDVIDFINKWAENKKLTVEYLKH